MNLQDMTEIEEGVELPALCHLVANELSIRWQLIFHFFVDIVQLCQCKFRELW